MTVRFQKYFRVVDKFLQLPVDLSTLLHVANAHLQIGVIEEGAVLLALSNDQGIEHRLDRVLSQYCIVWAYSMF